jgi:hypothetical protein
MLLNLVQRFLSPGSGQQWMPRQERMPVTASRTNGSSLDQPQLRRPA